ncbi:MAG: DUF1080 domain-containing protein [Planctomycetota bacterium]|nr:DUF1080 domain-containing protein [Planctomycetota bacterium]
MAAQKLRMAFLSLGVLGFCWSAALPLGAQCATPLRGQPIPLFDGKTLDGWAKQNGQPHPGWTVEEDAIYRAAGGGDLYHKHFYRDFELTFEWKIQANGNSGVKYRVQPFGRQMLGCEFQIQDDKQRVHNKQASGALYAVCEPSSNKQPVKLNEWNQAKIIVCGDRIEHWLNGERVVQTDTGSRDWLQRVEQSKFRDKNQFGQNREGRLFLQDHGQPVWFRNLVVVPLDCDRAFGPCRPCAR